MVSSTAQTELLELIDEKVVNCEKMSKSAKMGIFKDMTMKHLAGVFQRTDEEKLKGFLRKMLVKVSSHEGGAAINVDLSLDGGNSNKQILTLIHALKKETVKIED
jgi:hypothetical protein